MSRSRVSLGVQGMLIFACLLTVGCNALSHRKFWGAKDTKHEPALSQTVRPSESVTARKEWEAPEAETAFALDADLDEHPTALASAAEPISGQPTSPSQASILPENASVPGAVVAISGSDFEREVLQCEAPVLVDFYAPWCGPCKKMAPVLDQFAAETPNVKVVKVDIDQAPRIAEKFKVASVPTLLVFKDGEPTARYARVATREKIEELINR